MILYTTKPNIMSIFPLYLFHFITFFIFLFYIFWHTSIGAEKRPTFFVRLALISFIRKPLLATKKKKKNTASFIVLNVSRTQRFNSLLHLLSLHHTTAVAIKGHENVLPGIERLPQVFELSEAHGA